MAAVLATGTDGDLWHGYVGRHGHAAAEALAVTAPKRVSSYADLPSMNEQVPGFEVVGWYGVMGPPKLPNAISGKLQGELVKITRMKDIGDRILADGAEPVGSAPEEFRQYLLADLAKWARLVKESGAKLD